MGRKGGVKMRMPLAMLPEGVEAKIVDVYAGRGLMRRLAEMGFTDETKVKVLSSNHPGPVLVEVRDSRIAVGRGVAMKITVESCDGGVDGD